MIPGQAQQFFEAAAAQAGGDHQVDRSLRFNSADSAYLSRTPSTAGNGKTWTLSTWVKTSSNGSLLCNGVASSGDNGIYVQYSSNTLYVGTWTTSWQWNLITNRVFRDPSAWHHVVVAVDTTQSTTSDRVKIYINGVQETSFSTATYPSQNYDTLVNNTALHAIGRFGNLTSGYFDGYLADYHFIDGQALAPTDFGELDSNNVWNPKQFEGTYNTAASIPSYPAVTISPSTVGYGNVSHVNGGGAYFYSQASSGAGSIKVEFSPPITGVTSIKYNGGGYSVNSAYNIRINGVDVFTNLSTNSSWAQASHTISSTDISSFEIYTANDGWSLYNLLFNDTSPSGTASLVTPAGVNGFHLDFSDNSSNAALGTDSSGNSNTWTVNNLTAVGSSWDQSQTWSSSGSGTPYTANFDWDKAFDGIITTSTDVTFGASDATMTWTPSSPITVNTSVIVYVYNATNGTSYGTRVNGSYITGTNNYNVPVTLTAATLGGQLTSIQLTNSGLVGPYLGGVEVDGVLLVDSGVADPAAKDIDSLIDTPTNYTAASGNNGGNYPTWNPLSQSSSTFSNGNLQATTSGGSGYPLETVNFYTPPGTGKWYWEFQLSALSGSNYTMVGMLPTDSDYEQGNSNIPSEKKGFQVYIGYNGAVTAASGAATVGTATATFGVGDILGWAFDAGNGTVQCYKNGVAQGTQFTNVRTDVGWAFCVTDYDNSATATYIINYGSRPFAYTPPTDYVSLCTTNLADPTIADGSTAFDVKLWNGNDTQRDITGLGFSPDLVWIKQRSGTALHSLQDTVRGATKNLVPNDTQSEGTETAYLNAFLSNGFSIGTSSTVNDGSSTYVGWTWDAGTSTVSNTDGSITSSVRANPSAGFSVVSYTGSSSAVTVGHGLNAAPQMIIVKDRDNSYNWQVAHIGIGADESLLLNAGDAKADYNAWNNTRPTSSLFSLGAGTLGVNTNGADLIAYCFAPVEGYSAFGSYTGNGSADGPFVFTGMRPRWLMVKSSSNSGEHWLILDTERDPHNLADATIYANLSNAEAEAAVLGIDILSNGFKCKGTNAGANASGYTYVYAAFASHPFKTARAR
tara:strand:- start:32428 stop:35664 length:3237 start_codon:yes stop_codon:yes gene_type:complete